MWGLCQLGSIQAQKWLWFLGRIRSCCLVSRFVMASIAVLVVGDAAQAWVWPYRPEYAFGWGYVPPFGFGYQWKYPYVVDEGAARYDEVLPSDISRFCARRFRTYDPTTGTYIAHDGR